MIWLLTDDPNLNPDTISRLQMVVRKGLVCKRLLQCTPHLIQDVYDPYNQQVTVTRSVSVELVLTYL